MAVGYFPMCAFYVDKWQYLIATPGGEMYYVIIEQPSKKQQLSLELKGGQWRCIWQVLTF